MIATGAYEGVPADWNAFLAAYRGLGGRVPWAARSGTCRPCRAAGANSMRQASSMPPIVSASGCGSTDQSRRILQGQPALTSSSAAGYTSMPPGSDRTPVVSFAGSILLSPMMCATGAPSANR
jgi:hypothetical protein